MTVPDVTGNDPEAACASLQQARLACTPQAVTANERPENRVFAQEPAAGSTVAPGSGVTVRFAVRGTVAVPSLVDLPIAEAEARLGQLGLVPEPQARSGAGPRDPVGVVLPGQAPAPGTETKVGGAVRYSYWADRAPLPFDPAPLVGQPQNQACQGPTDQGFTNCAVAVGDAAPNSDLEGTVYAVDPDTAGSYPVDVAITAFYYGPYQPKTATLPALAGIGCTPVEQFNTNNPGMNLGCNPQPSPTKPGGATPVNGVISQDPAPGSVVTEGQTATVYLYQPPLRAVIDWQRNQEATHTLRDAGSGPPAGDGQTWSNVATMQLFAEAEPGSVPIYCWRIDGNPARHYCGTKAPPAYSSSGWVVGFGGSPLGWAYPGNPGFPAVGRYACGLVRTEATGEQYPIGSYYNGSTTCVVPNQPATDRYEIWDEFWTVG